MPPVVKRTIKKSTGTTGKPKPKPLANRKSRIRGGVIGSIAAAKSSIKKGGGSHYLSRVPAEGSLSVRFLSEPDEWVEYFEHFDQVKKFFPCADDCDDCRSGEKPSKRYLTNAVDVTENKVIPLVLPKSAATMVMKKYDKYNTILDRDYEIARTGSGLDTEYDVTPEPPTRMNLDRFDPLDLIGLLEAQLDEADAPKEEKDTPRTSPRASSRKTSKKDAAQFEDEDEDEDEDDEDEEEAPPPRRVLKKAPSRRVVSKPTTKAPAKRVVKRR